MRGDGDVSPSKPYPTAMSVAKHGAPREPTSAMLSKGLDTCYDHISERMLGNVWRAMHDVWSKSQP